jgi:1,4-alpha-glucan branching enzyme
MKKPVRRLTKEEAEQTFSIRAPGARSVHLAADFTEWQQRAIPMKPLSDGLWSAAVTLPAGTYQYRFLVDGEWRDDPNCTVRAPNSYGTQNMVRVVPEASVGFAGNGPKQVPYGRQGSRKPGVSGRNELVGKRAWAG